MAVVAFLAWYLNRDTLPPRPATFSAPAPVAPHFNYIVKQADASNLVISGDSGTPDIRVPRPAATELLAPGSIAEIRTGDWINVIGILDEVRNFSIRAVIVVAGVDKPAADGAGYSPGGFSGIEVRPDPAERIVVGGKVTAIDGEKLSLAGPAGDMTLTLLPRATIFRLGGAPSSAIGAGDRIAALAPLKDGQQPATVLAGRITSAAGQ